MRIMCLLGPKMHDKCDGEYEPRADAKRTNSTTYNYAHSNLA